MPSVVKNAYANCHAKNPATCRYHGRKYVQITEFKNIKDMFTAVDKQFPAALTLSEAVPDLMDFVHESDTLAASLSSDENFALHRYCDEYGSLDIFRYLHNPNYAPAWQSVDNLREQITIIDSIIDSLPAPTKPKTLYRGIKKFYDGLSGLKVGSEVSFDSYASNSSDLNTAKDFTTKDAPILFKIVTKKKAAPIKMGYMVEYEYLIKHGSKFKVSKKTENVKVNDPRPNKKNLEGVTLIELTD
jgi:hypothetical protein